MENNITASLQSFFSYHMSNIYTSIPCEVVKVDSTVEARVSVRPLIQMVDRIESVAVNRPVLLGVPLQMPGSSTSLVNIPVKQGDIVLCVFSMRGLDAFKAGDGTAAAPTDFRMFDKRDAIAIPGVFPFELHPNQRRVLPFNPDALSLTSNIGTALENTVELSETGVKTQMGAAILNVTPVGVDITGLLTINGIPFPAHTHSGVTTGGGVSGPVVI